MGSHRAGGMIDPNQQPEGYRNHGIKATIAPTERQFFYLGNVHFTMVLAMLLFMCFRIVICATWRVITDHNKNSSSITDVGKGSSMDASTLHQAMLCPANYADEEGPVSFTETHISRLYFTKKHVYKIKKPVDFGFLNFTTLEQRRFYCHEEVTLNTRFCPNTYLNVVEIRKEGDIWHIGSGNSGKVVDYAVRMKRLPLERMLEVRIDQSDPDLPLMMERLGRHLAKLHLQAPPQRKTGKSRHRRQVQLNWDENLRQTAPFVGDSLQAEAQKLMSEYVQTFTQQAAALLDRREEAGFVIDGHGDLHAEHICLTDPICIYDCIEFNNRFRIDDRVADLAFLLMDLEHRGRKDLAGLLATAYLAASGADPDFNRLLPFYKIYRAWVRGKVMSLLSRDTGLSVDAQENARRQAQDYFNQALGYLCPKTLVLTCGLMGAGKTAVAVALARALQGTHLRSDVYRKTLQGRKLLERGDEEFGAGIYRKQSTELTYRSLFDDATRLLHQGTTVVVDASFARRADRTRFSNAAKSCDAQFLILWLSCDDLTRRQRLRQRNTRNDDASDGREELLEQQKRVFESPCQEMHILPLDTGEPIPSNVQTILCHLAVPIA